MLEHMLLVLKLTERGLLVVLEPVTGIADGAFDIGVALFASHLNSTVNELLEVIASLDAA